MAWESTIDKDAKSRLERAKKIAKNNLGRIDFAIAIALEDLTSPYDRARRDYLTNKLTCRLRQHILRKQRDAREKRGRSKIRCHRDARRHELYHSKRVQ